MEGRYNNPEVRKAREMSRRITRQFGDPNMGQEYRDPYASPMFAEISARKASPTGKVGK